MKTAYAILVTLALTGCATTKTECTPRTQTVEVKVPVMTPIPEPAVIPRPELKIYQLSEADKQDPGKVALFYQATIKQLMGYAVQLETVVDGYRNLSKGQKSESK